MRVATPRSAAERPAQLLQSAEWNRSAGKRLFDLLLGSVLLLLTSPLLALVALLIKLSSPGPVFYCQLRVGQHGRVFQLIKFRTMAHTPQQQGPKVTKVGDPRVTRVGRMLRKWKLDELPQLINVVRGEMSFVGPRPDVAEYIESLAPGQKQQLLAIRPGLTGAASIRYRNEEEVLSDVPAWDLQRFYCSELLPRKVAMDLEYGQKAGFLNDCAILLRTFAAILK